MTRAYRRVNATDDRVRLFRDLTDADWRVRVESESGTFIAEGETVITRAIAAGLTIRTILGEERRIESLAASGLLGDAEVLIADPEVMRAIAGYRVHRGALAVVDRPAARTLEWLIAQDGDVIVLEDLVDPTNVGLVARSAAALGIGALLLSPSCADPLYRRAVKVSMGAVLTLPVVRSADWPGDLDLLRRSGIAVLGLSPQGPDIDDVLAEPPGVAARTALVLGTEGPGLSPAAMQRCTRLAGIPMVPPVDSLNVAAAAAVACYALRAARRRGVDRH